MRKGKRKPECHPNRAHYAKGLCASCYHARAVKKKKQKGKADSGVFGIKQEYFEKVYPHQEKQPVRVTHTHEVIREVASMATTKEEKDEQAFFAQKVKEQQQQEKHTMAANETKHDTKHEPKAEPVKRPEWASKEAVVSDAGVTEPTAELGGDGVTPKAEWDKHYAEFRKQQDEFDEKRRQRAVADAGPMLTVEKQKHAAILAAEERRHAEAQKHEQAEVAAHKHND